MKKFKKLKGSMGKKNRVGERNINTNTLMRITAQLGCFYSSPFSFIGSTLSRNKNKNVKKESKLRV